MGQKCALIIATAEYQDAGLARLAAPGLDAHDFAGALKAPHIGAFDSVQTLLNEAEPVVRRAIARFFDQRKPDDLLLLYFSGHGVRDDHGSLYLAVNDTDRGLLSATAIPANFVNEQMNASRSRRLVLILDCCNSGAFAQGSKAPLGGSMGIATAFEGTGYGRVVLTATDATQYAWEGDEARGEAANSVFTHFLVQGLETGAADANGDGRITLDELYDYVYEQVVTQTPRQTPRKFAYNQQGEVVIAHNPRPVPAPAVLPLELQQALESSLAGVREAAVRELDSLLRGSHRGLSLAAVEALERLVNDDSRRVSAAAAASLAAHSAAQRAAQQQAEQAQAAREQLAREALAERQAAANRLAAEQAAQQLAAEKLAADTLAAQARQARAQQAEADRVARERAALAKPPAPQPLEVPAGPPGDLHNKEETAYWAERPNLTTLAPDLPPQARLAAAWPALAPWVYTALAAIGWGYARVFAYQAGSLIYGEGESAVLVLLSGVVYWMTTGALGGLALSLILALAHPQLRGRPALVAALRWSLASGLGGALTEVISNNYSWPMGHVVGPAVMGTLGGLALVRALAGGVRTVLTRRQVMIVAGWAGASIVQYYVQDVLAFDVSEFTAGALAGLIGGGLMFWLLRANAPAGTADTPLLGPGWEAPLRELRQGPAWRMVAPLAYTALAMLGWGEAGNLGNVAYELVYNALPDDMAQVLAPAAYWVTSHTLGAAVMAGVLALSRPALRSWRAPALVAGWWLVSALGWGLSVLAGPYLGSKAGLWLGLIVVGAVGGGLLTWAVGRPADPAARQWLGLIALGWAIGLAAPYFADIYFSDAFGHFGDAALAGLIGGGVTFWLLRERGPAGRG